MSVAAVPDITNAIAQNAIAQNALAKNATAQNAIAVTVAPTMALADGRSFPEHIVIPAPKAQKVEMRYAPLLARDIFGKAWQMIPLKPVFGQPGYWEINLATLSLPDGIYEYDFVIDGRNGNPIADPYAADLEKFGDYRSKFEIVGSGVITSNFNWDDEIPRGLHLPENNRLVIYELPLRWMATAEASRQVDLGTFEKMVFEHLDELHALGVNCIELLPTQDSPDTLNWGYGTRFFFAPDWDMGAPLDMKYFIKRCHQYGIRVILDVVMNHSRQCPLETLAEDWFYLPKGSTEEGDRQDWGGRLFRYAQPQNEKYHARDLMYQMADYWIREYRIDGFRIDEWKGIQNWDFLQEFRDKAWETHKINFQDRPFIVIGEDSSRRPEVTDDNAYRGHPLVDAIWNFDFRDEVRRIMNNSMQTNLGEPGRYDRIQNAISCRNMWNDYDRKYRNQGFRDLAKNVNYLTSHDVSGEMEQRLMDFYMGQILRYRDTNYGNKSEYEFIRDVVDSIETQPAEMQAIHAECLERIASTFALTLTSVGMPMFLAGEEFADVHDLDRVDPNCKMSDPVDVRRRDYLGHRTLMNRVGELIRLRTECAALQRNEIEFFYSHPTIDQDNGVRVFAYCRTNGMPLGSADQVIVIANSGPQNFYAFNLPWKWPANMQLEEEGRSAISTNIRSDGSTITLSLAPFQVRVFRAMA